MSKIEDGGAAFPLSAETMSDCEGMTLRDYFAGQAIEGHFHAEGEARASYAKLAYAMADALLAERLKP